MFEPIKGLEGCPKGLRQGRSPLVRLVQGDAKQAAAVIIDLKDCGGVPRPDGLGIP